MLRLALLLTALAVVAADQPPFKVPLMKAPPTVDGHVHADEWQVAAGFDGFYVDHGGGRVTWQQKQVRAYVGATADTLYVAIVSELPDEGELVAKEQPGSTKVVHDDALEVYVNPTAGAENFVDYQFLSNVLGAAQYLPRFKGQVNHSRNWTAEWPFANGRHDGAWHFECAVPIASMPMSGAGRTAAQGVWGIVLARDWKPGGEWEWSSLTGGYRFKGWPFAFVETGAPAVQFAVDGDRAVPGWTGTLSMYNPGAKPLQLKAAIDIERNNMFAIKQAKDLTLAPGATDTLTIGTPDNDGTELYRMTVSVTGADGEVFYQRTTKWAKADPVRYVSLPADKIEVLPVDFRFAHYPYRKRMRIEADISGMPKDAVLAELTATIRDRLEETDLLTVAFPVDGFDPDGRQEIAFATPDFTGEGYYEIAMQAKGKNLPENARRVQTFERKLYPWEETPSGRSTAVFPPFTPIVVAGNRLDTVLRTHTLNGFGLWDQVRATSAQTGVARDILAAPMTYTARVGGQPVTVKAAALEIAAAAPDHAVVLGGFTAGPLTAKTVATWDYDGCVKVDLTLEPTGEAAVDELLLEIPFSAAAATLMHANSDRIRNPVAQRVPAGTGEVWNGADVANDAFIPNFCPYVFLGDAVRGICWFAENDLNWGWNPETPNMTVCREGDRVVLRVRLINQPTIVETPRTLSFGLLAAPVKPRLSPGGPNYWRHRLYRDRYTVLGGSVNWFAYGQTDPRPAGDDFWLWEMLKRGNEEPIPRDIAEQVADHGERYFRRLARDPEQAEKRVENWRRHCFHNMSSRYGTKMVFYWNRGSYAGCDEWRSFQDEWYLTDFRSVPRSNSPGEIKTVPSGSYVDFFVYWYARSFEIAGNRGVYWDNYFIRPTFNTEMTDAYQRPDGAIVPAAGIWGLRDLVKRTFVMMNERDMLPITWIHMTSFNCLPLMAFATVQWDWEWKYGQGDTQDRFTRELIQLETTGEQAGVWPGLLGDKSRDCTEHMRRTYLGVSLVHELDGGVPAPWVDHAEPLIAAADHAIRLLDDPALQVYRYWDERPQPVTSGNPDLPLIVYVVPGRETLVPIVSYVAADTDVTLTVAAEALGLSKGFVAQDAETNAFLPVADGNVTFPLLAHDFRLIRLVPE